MFFSKFGEAEFAINGKKFRMEDLTKKVANFPDEYFNSAYLKPYRIPEGMRPDQLADKIYNDPNYWWVVFVANGITINDWPLDRAGLAGYMAEFAEEQLNASVHTDPELLEAYWHFKASEGNIPHRAIDRSNRVTLRDVIEASNEEKRLVKVVKPEFIGAFETDFFNRMA